MSRLVTAPFDQSRYVGTICAISPSNVEINLPKASAPNGTHFAGFDVAAGQVGEFVVIEGEAHAILCRVLAVRLPERERLLVEPTSRPQVAPNPIGTAQLLTGIDLETGLSTKGIPLYPRIGQHVFSAHPLLVKQAVESGQTLDEKSVRLAVFPHAQNTAISMSPNQIFGRHCAVLGATGGGKSWTVAKLVEEVRRLGGKTILLDATGEFHTQDSAVRHVHLGGQPEDQFDEREFACFPYNHLSDNDLFALFRPSAGAQAPKLREALRSLKIANLRPDVADQNGLVKKAGQPRMAFEKAMTELAKDVAQVGADFDVTLLPRQIVEECVFSTGFDARAATHWGGTQAADVAYCTTLMARIEAETNSSHMACVFSPGDLPRFPDVVEEFLINDDENILRVSLEMLPFEHNTREIVVNAIGRYLLRTARQGRFRSMPLVVMLDEAHQFLDKSVGDEASKILLDAFGLIAKEGRKYGLTCVLATQRPRDIPEDVLSQMGTFIVHRLINERDRAMVERACGNFDSSAADFLPTLGQGEAIIVGVDSPMPLPVLINRPRYEPKSRSPDYDNTWGIDAALAGL